MLPIICEKIPDHLQGLGLKKLKVISGHKTYLKFFAGNLSLFTPSFPQRPLHIDFGHFWRRLDPQDKRGPLFKALGPNLKRGPIWDLTCGMGQDSLLMLFFGAEVIAFERNKAIGALLLDAYKRALEDELLAPILADRFTLLIQDAREWAGVPPSIIYYDPMYEKGPRKSLQKKEMRIFAEVVGEDQDAKEVLNWALGFSTERVVVKRSLRGASLLPPSFTHRGKSTRYDVFKTQMI